MVKRKESALDRLNLLGTSAVFNNNVKEAELKARIADQRDEDLQLQLLFNPGDQRSFDKALGLAVQSKVDTFRSVRKSVNTAQALLNQYTSTKVSDGDKETIQKFQQKIDLIRINLEKDKKAFSTLPEKYIPKEFKSRKKK